MYILTCTQVVYTHSVYIMHTLQVYILMYTHVHVHDHARTHAHTQTHRHTQMYMHTHTHTLTHSLSHTHTRTHTHTRIHTHTQMHTQARKHTLSYPGLTQRYVKKRENKNANTQSCLRMTLLYATTERVKNYSYLRFVLLILWVSCFFLGSFTCFFLGVLFSSHRHIQA